MKEKDAASGFETSRRGFLVAASGVPAFMVSSLGELSRAAHVPRPSPARIDLDRFVADCVAASREPEPQAAVLEVLARTVRQPAAVRTALGETTEAGIRVLHRSKTLTIFSATWAPNMNLMPHDHRMWAAIGIYSGREDNILWRRSPGRITAHGAKALFEGDAVALPASAIHSVTNPLSRFTGGLHVYGGDFFDTARSQWNPETLAEEPSDGDTIREIFRRENERMRRCGGP
jgi:predicted metal-dependent enzyme (double-stranded beta helix superfamily)